ncbi:MAG: replicative DNA helicase [Calothrix sp. FI2-JRJ7]|jgi:replicative DNA helicase|nr:replicative DNA helicase [Calothrix sp. FI2-JRJ7]
MVERIPPSAIDIEEAILGGIMLDPNAISKISDTLIADAFYISTHQIIYTCALRLHHEGKPTDLLSVTNWLLDSELLGKIGGRNKLAMLLESTVSAVNIDAFAQILIDKYTRRRLISVGNRIVELGYEQETNLESILDRSEQNLYEVSNAQFRRNTEHNSAISTTAYEQLLNIKPIYPTGYRDLDDLMVGFEPGTLTILGGRSSMGKSFISCNLAYMMMKRNNLPVVIFSLEMSKLQLEYRFWSLISITQDKESNILPINTGRIQRHRSKNDPLDEYELQNMKNVSLVASQLPLYINDSRDMSLSKIASECRQIIANVGSIGLVIVDYVQMMAEDSGGNRSYELGDVARGLYKIAGELDFPILALSQISRSVENRQDKRPLMSDLSQSGILETVADNILLAYRDEYYNPDSTERGRLELRLAKARHGEIGTVKFLFDTFYGVLKDLA